MANKMYALMRMILNKATLSLAQLQAGDCAKIVGFCVDDGRLDFLQRLYEVGFIVGEQLQVMHVAPLSRDPMSIKIKDAVYALRREDANLIHVARSEIGG